jgi:hypothetical protein
MIQTINQNAKRDIYSANIMIVVYEEGRIETYDNDEWWNTSLGETCGRFSYKNKLIKYIGRDEEKQWLHDFLNGSESFSVSAITGKAGNGKSSLLYNYCIDNLDKDEWLIKGIDFERINNILIQKIFESQKVLLIIDYVLIHADEIGAWIKQLHIASQNNKNIVIRILLIERAHVIENRLPYWYIFLVKKHNNESICKYENFLRMEDLEEENLKEIFKKYVIEMSKKEQNKSKHEIEEIERKCDQDIPTIFMQIDSNCKSPLFILYIAQAWMEGGKKHIRNWDRDNLLNYIEKKEEKRLRTFFNGNYKKVEKLKKILCFSIAISGIDLGGNISKFIRKDIIDIREEIGAGYATFTEALYDMGNYNDKEIRFESAMPEIVGEFFLLKHLKYHRDNHNKKYVKKFINAAWKQSPQAFAGFLCRVVEDFYNHEMTSFDGILAMPSDMTFLQRRLYADVVREYTYWNTGVKEYSEKVVESFNCLLKGCKDNTEQKIIIDKYAVTLFNMLWNSSKRTGNIDSMDDIKYFHIFESMLQKLKDKWNDTFINDVYKNAIAIIWEHNIIVG